MNNLIKIHRNNTQIDFTTIWKEGIFVFDSNVLLDLYRLPETARNDLISILEHENFKDRIWIGFQVLLEFLNNRYSTIGDQKNKFNEVQNLLKKAIQEYDQIVDSLNTELANLKLKQRHSLINPDKYITEKNIEKGKKYLLDFVSNLETLKEKHPDVNDDDEIKDIVLQLFKNKIGNGFNKKELEEIYKDGEERYGNKFPPGYKDNTKKGSHFHEDKEYIRKYGDLILWKEIIQKCKDQDLKYIVLITGDVKEDWWFEKRGKKLGPRIELLNEIYHNASSLDTFYMYDTSNFLKHAKQELKIDIKDESIKEVKELMELDKRLRKSKEESTDLVSVLDTIMLVKYMFSGLTIKIDSSINEIPSLYLFEETNLQNAIYEIFSNVMSHSINKSVRVMAQITEDLITLYFKNERNRIGLYKTIKEGEDMIPYRINDSRGKGINEIKKYLAKENITVDFTYNKDLFIVKLYIRFSKKVL
jgi:hypothetical protein